MQISPAAEAALAQTWHELGLLTDDVDSAWLDRARRLSGVTNAQLHHAAAFHLPVPAAMQEVLADMRVARQALELAPPQRAAALTRLHGEPLPLSAQAATVRRDFPGLSPRAAHLIADGASTAEHQRLTAGRVPLRLGEQARLALREAQLNRACIDLYLPAARLPDAERLLMAGVARLPRWPRQLAVELRDGSERGPLLARMGPADAPAPRIIVRQAHDYRLLAAAGRSEVVRDELSEVLVHTLTPAQWVALDMDDAAWMRQQVFDALAADRPLAARLLGQRRELPWLRPPVRQAEGLAGYALSGEGAGQIGSLRLQVRLRLRRLYPLMDIAQVRALQASFGVEPLAPLERLEAQYSELHASLDTWVAEEGAARDEHGNVVIVTPQQRRAAADGLLAAWRRETLMAPVAELAVPRYQLVLSDYLVGELPELTADFRHVSVLKLRRLGLRFDPSEFLRAFPRLEELDLQGNHLTELPTAIAGMADLRALNLRHNRLRPADTLFEPLAGLHRLDSLILSHNPMRLPLPALEALGGLQALTELRLNNTCHGLDAQGFEQLGRLSQLEELSLEDNGIVLPVRGLGPLRQLPALRGLSLAGNPLGEQIDLTPLLQVRYLDVSDAGLHAWPAGLSTLMAGLNLRWVSLRDNPLVDVPRLQGLHFFQGAPGLGHQRLEISAQGLSAVSLARLHQVQVEPVVHWPPDHAAQGPMLRLIHPGRHWAGALDAVQREYVAQFNEQADVDGLVDALDRFSASATYRRDPHACQQRIAALIRACCEPSADDPGIGQHQLRDDLLEHMTCGGEGGQRLLDEAENRVLFHRLAHVAEGAVEPLRALAEGVRRSVTGQGDTLDDEALCAWLVRQAGWRQCLARHSPEAFAQVHAPWLDGGRYLVETGREYLNHSAVPALSAEVLASLFSDARVQGQALGVIPGRSMDARQRLQAHARLKAARIQASDALVETLTRVVLALPA